MLEAGHLVGRSEPVLHRTEQAQRGGPVALEGHHGVHQVLEGARARHGVLTGRLAHQQRRQVVAFRPLGDDLGDLVDLGDTPRARVDRGGRDGLHRIHDEQRRPDLCHVREHLLELGLVGDEQVGVHGTDPPRPQSDLLGRLLARDIEDGAAALREAVSHVEQERGLPNPGLAGHQHHLARHESAAEHSVELLDACAAA